MTSSPDDADQRPAADVSPNEAAPLPEHFTITDHHAEYRPKGHVTLAQCEQMVALAITAARERNLRRLLVITASLTGFEPPSLSQRFFSMKLWATASRGCVRLAIVARPEMIDPQKFGITVAANSGLTADVFASEHDALNWLQSDRDPSL